MKQRVQAVQKEALGGTVWDWFLESSTICKLEHSFHGSQNGPTRFFHGHPIG